jgi:hypothetical protein
MPAGSSISALEGFWVAAITMMPAARPRETRSRSRLENSVASFFSSVLPSPVVKTAISSTYPDIGIGRSMPNQRLCRHR